MTENWKLSLASSAGVVKVLAITAGQSTRGGSVRDVAVLVAPHGVRAFGWLVRQEQRLQFGQFQ